MAEIGEIRMNELQIGNPFRQEWKECITAVGTKHTSRNPTFTLPRSRWEKHAVNIAAMQCAYSDDNEIHYVGYSGSYIGQNVDGNNMNFQHLKWWQKLWNDLRERVQ